MESVSFQVQRRIFSAYRKRVIIALKDVRRAAPQTEQKATEIVRKSSKELTLPAQDRLNPHASIDLPAYKFERAKLNHTIKGHAMAVSS